MANEIDNGRSIHILLVEDNPGDRRRVELILDLTSEVYQLHTAVSIQTAYQILTAHAIHIILLDLTLPDSQGVQTIRTLHTRYPHIPIVVLTGLDDEQIVADSATAGAQDFLMKQEINASNLWRVLRYALERRKQEEELRQSQQAYRRQALELNVLNRIISTASASNDEQALLAATCYELAHFFGALRVLILFCHQGSGVVIQAGHSQNDLPPLPPPATVLAMNDQLTAVLIAQHALICPTVEGSLQQFLAVPPGSRAIIHPINLENATIGFCVVSLPQTYALAESDARLVSMVADEVALGLTKMRLNGRLQAHANELEKRVQERTQALGEANEQLQSLDKLKTKFVSDVSHELRNPITNLSLYLELLEYAKPEKHAQYIAVLRNQVRRLYSLVEDILTLSRLEHSPPDHLFQPVDLNYLIQQVIGVHTPRAQSKQIKLQFQPMSPLPPAWAEPNQITQVVTNLIDNALNYTAKGSIIVTTNLLTQNSQTDLLLCVTDTGMGIHQDDLPHIFERFYRGSHIDRKTMVGTGLGLGIVKEIVIRHNGRIHVSSTVNQGSTFTVTLPTAPQA
ncbi:MAG: ATP-binding protein [Candidatus Promineifilaceae bacterium]|nr:response regulator [Anaerolineaceae bacterium]